VTDEQIILTVAVLGGTGKEGSGLAARWAAKGYRVIIGSRAAERAEEKAAELNGFVGAGVVSGMENYAAAMKADVVVLTVPYAAHQATLEAVRDALTGKILIDVTVPVTPPKVRTVQLPQGQSAAMEAQALLGDEVRVVAAFQNVSAEHLVDVNHIVECDVLVCGDDREAKLDALKLVEAAGMRGFDAGKLQNAIAVESLTPVLIDLNIRYKGKGAGIRITGLDA
jgi:NADPH-dependent F420 reductase